MEDGVKEDPAQCKEPKFLGKAGWVKKAPGRLLASYKDRYIHVEKTEIVVYENEDLKNCLERLDLENYDKCHELKSPFKKKHRLMLIRSARSGNKVHDMKLQVQTAEEKEAWIKALNDGISRAKNKVFDEVKVDESSNLEHVTRTRPKGNRNRRPPTRIHMKEVAVVSSDGILRLDLDLEDAMMPNGMALGNTDGTETPKEAVKVPTPLPSVSKATEKQSGPSAEEGPQTEPAVSPLKKVIKPPMPPTKEAKPSPAFEDEPTKDLPDKKVLKPPMPPSKEAKSCISPVEEVPEETSTEQEKSPDTRKKTGPPPTPPNKPSSSSSIGNLAEASQSRQNPHPPTPPSKENKPSHPPVASDQGAEGTAGENEEEEEDNRKETTGAGGDEADHSGSEEAVPSVRGDESPSTEDHGPEEETMSSPGPLLTSNKKPDMQHTEDNVTVSERQEHTASLQTASDTSDSSLQEEETLPKSKIPSVVVSSNGLLTDSISLSPLLCLPGDKRKKAEEKSVDSGQHSDDDSSGSEDTLAASTAALRGSHAGLDVLDASENGQISISLRLTEAATKPQVRSKAFPSPHSKPTTPLKPSSKARSASIGDLLSNSSVCTQTRPVAINDRSPADDVMKLETEVALEREKTGELLRRVSQSQGGGDREHTPEDLLAKALEKLEKANLVLREVKKLKLARNSRDRKSW
ncbi:pleckstrin homology domain-containing family O member 2 [Trachinotus anak]|uniref:pleckstrin homology domain-containing family O member 2 n=1 Tax=Trachinotus anak TaxID=443729 RepID=UPI0039F17D4C